MAYPHKYALSRVAKMIGVDRHTTARWAKGQCPRGFPVRSPLRTTPKGKLLLQPAEVECLKTWVFETRAGNRGKVLAGVRARLPQKQEGEAWIDPRLLDAVDRQIQQGEISLGEMAWGFLEYLLDHPHNVQSANRYLAELASQKRGGPGHAAKWEKRKARRDNTKPPPAQRTLPLRQMLVAVLNHRGIRQPADEILARLASIGDEDRARTEAKIRDEYLALGRRPGN